MIGGTVVAWILLSLAALSASAIQDPTAPPRPLMGGDVTLEGLRGRVIVDGVPVDRVVEVRLDSQTLGKTLATAYTLGSEEFQFQRLPAGANDTFFLVIDEDGYEEIRYPLDDRDFVADPRDATRLRFVGVLVFHLEREAPGNERTDEPSSPAVVDVRQLTAVIPDAALEEYESALVNLAGGRDPEGLDHLEAAVRLAPDYYDALNKLGIEYLKAGRYRDAEDSLERARGLSPNDPRPLVNLGMLHFQEGQSLDVEGEAEPAHVAYLRAVGVFEEAVRIDPLSPISNFYLGSAVYEIGQPERAEVLLARALQLNEQLHDARLALVNVYTRLARYGDALEQITAYLEANPDSPQRGQLEAVKNEIERVLEQ